ncbi:MAG: ABC transporter permease [Rhodospirillaceae bacterium]|nr:ABC transporter permease [Rhodospirillaceae bacterium]
MALRRRGLSRPSAVVAAAIFAFLLLPLLVIVPESFTSAEQLSFPPPGFSLRWYRAYLADPAWIDATLRSLGIAAAVTVLATVLGTLLAVSILRGRYPGRALVSQIATAPLAVPTIVYSVAVYGLFAGLKLVGQWHGVMLAHTVHALPFVVLIVGAGLRTVDPAQELAAMGLGATRLGALLRVTLPQIRPALISAAFLAFVSSFDEIVIAMFLGGVNKTLPMKMFDNIQMEIEPTVAAVSVLQIALAGLALAAAARFGKSEAAPR